VDGNDSENRCSDTTDDEGDGEAGRSHRRQSTAAQRNNYSY
jgi:hypothetical protein